MTFEDCAGWRGKSGPPPQGVSCPPRLVYPPPPDPVEVLFIGWNPPGEKHFWNSTEDNLYHDLSRVFSKLGWLTTQDLWAVFQDKKFYLVHAVKCISEAKFRWDVPNLIGICAESILKQEIANLQPRIICALGKVPHMALRAIWRTTIPRKVKYGEGWVGSVEDMKIIVTSFPNWHLNRAESKSNRDCTVAVLRKHLA